MATPPKRRVESGTSSTESKRTTPKGTRPGEHPKSSTRYTPPSSDIHAPSPPWVAGLMFTFLGVGMLLIFVNYVGVLWETNGWYMLAGLGSILAGIITATQLK